MRQTPPRQQKGKILITYFKKTLVIFLFIYSTAHSENTTKQHKIIMLGDSLTAGYGVMDAQAYPSLIEKKLKKDGFSIKITNASISGSTTASGLSRLKWQLKSQPSHLILALGANDGLRGIRIEEISKNLENTILEAKKNGIKVMLIGMKIPPNYGLKYSKEFESVFIKISEKHNIPLLPFLLEGVGGEKQLNQADGIHPNSEGHKVMADNVIQFLKKHLKKGK